MSNFLVILLKKKFVVYICCFIFRFLLLIWMHDRTCMKCLDFYYCLKYILLLILTICLIICIFSVPGKISLSANDNAFLRLKLTNVICSKNCKSIIRIWYRVDLQCETFIFLPFRCPTTNIFGCHLYQKCKTCSFVWKLEIHYTQKNFS